MDGNPLVTRKPAPWERRLDAILASVERHPHRWLAACAVLLATQISPWWFPTPDSCSYLSMGRSLAETGTMTNLGSPHWRYPPGYSLLVSPLFLVEARPFLLISLLHWALAVLWTWGVYFWAKRLTGTGAIWIALLAAVNALVWIHIRQALTELAFMTLLIWTVVLMATLVPTSPWRSIAWRAALAAAMVATLVTIRQSGMVLAAGFGMALGIEALKGRATWWRAITLSLVIVLPGLVVVLGLLHVDASQAAALGNDPYVAGFTQASQGIVGQVLEGVRLRISDVGRLTIPGMFKAYGPPGRWLDASWIVSFVAFLVVSAGWWRFAKCGADVLVWMWPFYFALHCVWAWDSGARYLVPVIPLLVAGLWFALASLPAWRVRIVAGLLVCHGMITVGYWATKSLPRTRALAANWSLLDEMAATIATESGPIESEGLEYHVRLMLQLATDRPVVPREESHISAARAHWLVQPRGSCAEHGFVVRRIAGDFQLAVRQGEELHR